jgi:hypothetical protein
MRIISLIQDPEVIRQILKHLWLWKQDAGYRCKKPKPDHGPKHLFFPLFHNTLKIS